MTNYLKRWHKKIFGGKMMKNGAALYISDNYALYKEGKSPKLFFILIAKKIIIHGPLIFCT